MPLGSLGRGDRLRWYPGYQGARFDIREHHRASADDGVVADMQAL